jgi:uncharacterized membrane protein
MKRVIRWFLIALVPALSLLLVPSAWAQQGDPPTGSPALSLTTEFPSVVIGIEESPSLSLTLQTETQTQVAALAVEGLPKGWTASYRGRGRAVHSAYVAPGSSDSIDLNIKPADGVEPGTYDFTATAKSDIAEASLPLEITVQEQALASLSLNAQLPTLRGQPSTDFRYSTTLRNEGDRDLTVNLLADAPPSFGVTFTTAGQDVTSLPMEANGSKSITVEAKPQVDNLPAGSYPITVQADGGVASATLDLTADVVGQSSLNLTTPDGRLSGDAIAGRQTTFSLLVQNTGSAPAGGINMSSTPPNGWTVDFDPAVIEQLQPGQQQEVTASVKPADEALAGDYIITYCAQPDGGTSQSVDYRVTVRTSTVWGVVGVALIAIAIGVVGWAVCVSAAVSGLGSWTWMNMSLRLRD